MNDVLVIHDGRCHGQGENPNYHHADEGMFGHPDPGGLSGVYDGHVSVHRHCREGEDADQHGNREEIVDKFTNEGAQDPGLHHVNGRLERDAKEQVGQVCDAQIEDEDVGGAAWFSRFAPGQDGDHHGVTQHTEHEDESENHQRDEIIRADPE